MSLAFDPGPHLYSWNGAPVPSVTQVMSRAGLATDYSGVPWPHLANAAKLGTEIHQIIAALLRQHGDVANWLQVALDFRHPHPRVRAAVIGFCGFMNAMTGRIQTVAFEQSVYSGVWGFAGTYDWRGFMNGRRTLLEWKTTSVLDEEAAGFQTAGYAIGHTGQFPDEPIEDRGVLWLRKDGTPKLVMLDGPEHEADESTFLWALGQIGGVDPAEWAATGAYVYEF